MTSRLICKDEPQGVSLNFRLKHYAHICIKMSQSLVGYNYNINFVPLFLEELF